MVGFLNAGFGKLLPQCGARRGEGLGGVKRLGADLADMIHTHETGGDFLLLRRELSGLIGQLGAGLGGVGRCEKGSQSGITGDQDVVRGGGHSLKHTTQHIPLAFYWLFFFVALMLQKLRERPIFTCFFCQPVIKVLQYNQLPKRRLVLGSRSWAKALFV
jgi:hypothetical protein